MKTNQNIFKAIASLALAFGAFASAQAQSNLGASCGCPAVASRPTINVTSLPGYVAINGTYGGELTQGATFTCDKTYILDKKIYIPAGQTLNIAPGTVIKGALNTVPAEATALIIERGGKINAAGTESCPIVFTAFADPMDGTYAVSNTGKWGGVVLLGKASNNLTLTPNGPFVPGGSGKLAVADGLGTVEGFASSNPQDQYGVATATPLNVASGTIPTPNTYSFTQTVNSATTTTLTLSGNASSVLPGMLVSGTGIAAGTLVSSVQGSVVTLNTATTGAVTQATFEGVFMLPAGTSGQFFTGTAPTYTSGTGPWVGNINYSAPFVSGGTGFNDDDNSGVMKYVSIRHSGAILAVGAEINGLTLASVGRGTTIEHIEIVSCADDNIEVFGGTVNLKYITTLFGNDDMFDYDLGWKGKAQFFFGMKNTTAGSSPDNDNGIEADSDDNTSNSTNRSHPVLYNFTIIGNGKATPSVGGDNRGLAGVNFKEGSEGELYNSIFVNFKNGINLVKSLPSGRTFDSYQNWTSDAAAQGSVAVPLSLKIKCNTIWTTGVADERALGIGASSSTAIASAPSTVDNDQFVADLNTVVSGANGIPGMSYNFTIGTNNSVTVKNDVTPTTALSVAGCPTAPIDGFFEPANYRGAFSSTLGENWLSNWTYSQVLNSTSGVRACATDLNLDGTTDVNDFLIFAPAFGTSCN